MFTQKFNNPYMLGGLLVFLFFLSIAGCSEPTPPPEPVTISFGYTGFENRAAIREYYQEMADHFNQQYPHITVEVGFDNLSPLTLGGEIDRDVLLILNYLFFWMLPNEHIIPLDDLIAMDPSFPVDDYLPGILDFYVFDGKTWGIPGVVNPYMIFYNREIFDQKGVPYPSPDWAWGDFLDAAIATRDPESGVYGYGSTNFFAPDSRYSESLAFVYQHGGVLFDDFKTPTQFLYGNQRVFEALEWYTQLYTLHDVAPTEKQALEIFGGNSDNTIYQGIANGKVAMWGGGFSSRNGSYWWPAPWSFPVGILPPPRDEQSFYPSYSNAYVITAESQYPEEAWLWISFLSEQLNPDGIPVRISMIESDQFKNNVGSENVDNLRMMVERLETYPLFLGSDVSRDWVDFQRVLARTIDHGIDLQDTFPWAGSQ